MLTLAAHVALFALLLVAAVSDIRERRIANEVVLSIAGVWAAWRMLLIACALADGADAACVAGIVGDSFEGVVAAALVGGGLLVMTTAYEHVRGTYAFGGGDVKLLAATALFVGLVPLLFVLGVACAVSLLYALLDGVTKAHRGIPFAPCVACGFPLALLLVL